MQGKKNNAQQPFALHKNNRMAKIKIKIKIIVFVKVTERDHGHMVLTHNYLWFCGSMVYHYYLT